MIKLILISCISFFTLLEAKNIEIKSKIIKLNKKSIKNKNIYFFWNEKEKKLHIKRNRREIQIINFGVEPSGISLIDVNFDGYADVVLYINEDTSGEYRKDGEYKHFFYYLYDRSKKKFIYHKELSSLIYDTQNVRQTGETFTSKVDRRQALQNERLRGYQFDAKKKVLVISDASMSFYGIRTYDINNRKLTLREKGFRVFPENYPNGVDTQYIYNKDGNLTIIKAYKDGNPKIRKNVKIVLKPKEDTMELDISKLPKENEEFEKLLLNSLHNLFINHQISSFHDKHFFMHDELDNESDLMYTVMLLDTMFKREGQREKNDTLFELIEKFSNIKKLEVEDFRYEKEKAWYTLDVKLHMKKGTERYRWHFFKKKSGIYFLPIAHDEKSKVNIALNANIFFHYEVDGLRVMNKKDYLQVSTPVDKNEKKGWFTADEECTSKYIEFRLHDYTGNGVLDWFQTCSRSLSSKNKGVKKYHLKYGTHHYFSMMIPQSGNRYSWNEKKKRFVFAKTKYKAHYAVCNLRKNDKIESHMVCDKVYWQETGKEYTHLISDYSTYIDKRLFEESIDKDELHLEDARDKVKKGTKLYWNLDDIKLKKEKYKLDEDEYILAVDKSPVFIWDKNISTTKPSQKMISVSYKHRSYWMDIEQLKKRNNEN